MVTCPENGRKAGVEVNASHAALAGLFGGTSLRLDSCSRWPEREGCGQECLSQIEASPEGCLVRTMLTEWYAGASCAYCGLEIPEIHWSDHKPALLTPDGKTIEWDEVKPEELPRVLATHWRVCWNCHIAQSFRQQHPERVVDNPWKTTGGAPGA